MEKINLSGIKKAEIAVCIPSFNERDNIGFVAFQIDKGLRKYFKNKKAVIINCDNNSPDGTKEFFLSLKTKTPKIYISSSNKEKGKGINLLNFFKEAKKLKIKTGASLDADLKSIKPEWIKYLISPIFKKKDYLVPIYKRSKYDGSITNHFCYPLIYGFLGAEIRQPIAGDFSFSERMINYFLKEIKKIKNKEYLSAIKGYGIDIFMTLNAIKSGYKIAQIELGKKIHKPSAPKLEKMFLEVSKVFFEFLIRNKSLFQKKKKVKKIPKLNLNKIKTQYPKGTFILNSNFEEKIKIELEENYFSMKNIFSQELSDYFEKRVLKQKRPSLEMFYWPEIIYSLLSAYRSYPAKKEKILAFLKDLYFSRVFSFLNAVKRKSNQEAEEMVQYQAKLFLKKFNHKTSF